MIKKYISFIALLIITGFFWGCGTSDSTEVYELTANSTPADGGTVSPASAEYDEGTSVEIEAEPSEEFLFVEWEGDISSSENPHSFVIENDVDVTAIFERKQYTLTIETTGGGSVEEEIIQAPKQTDYKSGTVVEVTATPEQSRVFTGWQGDLESQQNPESIIIENPKSITAVFDWGSPDNEDCVSLNPENVEIEEFGDDWRLVDGNSSIILLDEFEEAKKAQEIIQYYEFSNICFIDRPDAQITYWLVNGAPAEVDPNVPFSEDCLEIRPDNVEVEQSGSNWQVVDGSSLITTYENRDDAVRAVDTIQFYGFTQNCFVGRPDPDMQYWLR